MLKIIQIPLVLLIIWLGGGTWYWVCQVRGYCGDEPREELIVEAEDEPDLLSTVGQGIRFPAKGSIGFVPSEMTDELDQLADFLKKHPEKQLQVLGLYHRNESGTGTENLGLERAHFFTQLLEGKGVSPDQMTRLPKRLESAISLDTMENGLVLAFMEAPVVELPVGSDETSENADEDTGETGEKQVVSVPELANRFYFDFNQAGITLTDEERDIITRVMVLVRQDTTAQVILTGHTDDMDEEDFNYQLGLNRAKSVKAYFEAFGLSPERIEVASKGEMAPIGDNKTTEGRARNRRVELDVTVIR